MKPRFTDYLFTQTRMKRMLKKNGYQRRFECGRLFSCNAHVLESVKKDTLLGQYVIVSSYGTFSSVNTGSDEDERYVFEGFCLPKECKILEQIKDPVKEMELYLNDNARAFRYMKNKINQQPSSPFSGG